MKVDDIIPPQPASRAVAESAPVADLARGSGQTTPEVPLLASQRSDQEADQAALIEDYKQYMQSMGFTVHIKLAEGLAPYQIEVMDAQDNVIMKMPPDALVQRANSAKEGKGSTLVDKSL